MKELSAKSLFVLIDIFVIFTSLLLAYLLRNLLADIFAGADSYPLTNYTSFYPLYIITITLLAYEGIYTHRYDFWHESRIIFKGLMFSFFIILAYLALTKSMQDYSRAVIIFSFLFMTLLLPISKNICKKLLFKFGLWRRSAKIYGNDPFLKDEIFGNHYLGYVDDKADKPKTVFINSHNENLSTLKQIIDQEIGERHEVIFIPLIDDYDLTRSHIYRLSNTHTNLIVFQNRLKCQYRLLAKKISDLLMSIIIFPLLLPIMLYIAYKIRKEEPGSSILFKQERLGQNGKNFVCYKFRTMFEESDEKLNTYLKQNPEEIEFYDTYHKYQNDPRITKIGNTLRRTSLDELPQIFNVFKNEMSFIGPRPYMLNEKEKIGKDIDTVLTVKPGITGLWQVSGRSEVDFHSRVELDTWYIRNWNLWMDLVILLKTVKTVLVREGAS
ncbi:sugar transferase [Sulfurovum sp. TSL1]|uniref:sugar transferase n=1 Tax=Sulfurovum sp. TSL1 TaxID=2826994 RepID=UPI001CC4ECD5|nr:sugar transferase [Sulfurovum sp. TSL1]GIT98462.1 putative sugar transferase [Sulfurovum sp. TSL1]